MIRQMYFQHHRMIREALTITLTVFAAAIIGCLVLYLMS
jgi:hypothetical protein